MRSIINIFGYLLIISVIMYRDTKDLRYADENNIVYSRRELYSIGKQCKVSPPVLSDEYLVNIYDLGIVKRRGFEKPYTNMNLTLKSNNLVTVPLVFTEQKSIPVIPDSRKHESKFNYDSREHRSIDHQNLLTLSRHSDQNSTLRCASINARSIRNKAVLVNDIITEHNLDVLCIQETWLGKPDDDAVIAELLPGGYDFKHVPRTHKTGGGVGIVFRSGIRFEIIDNVSYNTFEKIEAKITIDNKSVRILSVYRPDPHGKNVPNFMNEFAELIFPLTAQCDYVLICGDLNFHLEKHDIPDVQGFVSLVESCGMKQLVTKPTHIANHILDPVIVSSAFGSAFPTTVTDVGISDHYLVKFDLHGFQNDSTRKTIQYRKIGSIDMESFKQDIANTVSLAGCDAADAAATYNDTLTEILDKHAPSQTKAIKIRPNTRWYTENIRRAKIIRRRLERRLVKVNTDKAKADYRKQCDIVNNLITSAKTEFNSNRVLESQHDQKRLFNVTKDLLRWNNPAVFPDQIQESVLPQVFLEFFIDKVIKIRNDISYEQRNVIFQNIRNNILPELDTTSGLSEFAQATEDEITTIIKNAPASSCLLDPIPTYLVKECVTELAPALTQIVNLSLSNSTVPDSLKKSVLIPLLKKPSLDKNILKISGRFLTLVLYLN